MELKDFLTLIQLAAALNVAYVAVGISQGYTRILLDKVFNIEQLLKEKFDPVRSEITINSTTLSTLKPTSVDGKSTNDQIEALKRDYEKLSKKIEYVSEKIRDDANMKCSFKCFSGLSLMMFLYCCTILFVEPFDFMLFVVILTAVILIYLIVGWIKSDGKIFCSLKKVIFSFVVTVVFGVLVSSLCRDCQIICSCMAYIRVPAVILIALLPFMNFVAFFFKINRNVRIIQKDIKAQVDNLETERNNANQKFDALQSLEQLKMKI